MRHLQTIITSLTLATLLSGQCVAQENPWIKHESGSNPWSSSPSTTTEPLKEHQVIKNDTVVKEITTETLTTTNAKNVVIIEKSEIDDVVIIKKAGTESTKRSLQDIEKQAEDDYKAGVALALSIPAIIFPPVTVPILITSVFVPTPQQNLIIEQYKREHPTADASEIKAVKRGIRKKRAKRTAAGAGIGLGVVLAGIGILIAN